MGKYGKFEKECRLYLEAVEPSEGHIVFETIKTESITLSITTDLSLFADIFAVINIRNSDVPQMG
jgi:hypothetical protein